MTRIDTEAAAYSAPSMKEHTISPNSGYAIEVPKGGVIQVRSGSIVDFVPFNGDDLGDLFDQATSIGMENSVFLSVGSSLYSKGYVKLLTIISDTYGGNHDLQLGPCSGEAYDLLFESLSDAGSSSIANIEVRDRGDLPTHGCRDNLETALRPHGVAVRDIPGAFNLFQCYEIGDNGRLLRHVEEHRMNGERATVSFLAETDVLIALSACPELDGGGGSVEVRIDYPA